MNLSTISRMYLPCERYYELSLPEQNWMLRGRSALLDAELDVKELLLTVNLCLTRRDVDIAAEVDGEDLVDAANIEELGLDVDAAIADDGSVTKLSRTMAL